MAAVAELRKTEQQPGELSRRDRIMAALVALEVERAIEFHLPLDDDVVDAVPGAREELGIPREEPVVLPPTTLQPFWGVSDIERIPLATEKENKPQEPEGDKEDQ